MRFIYTYTKLWCLTVILFLFTVIMVNACMNNTISYTDTFYNPVDRIKLINLETNSTSSNPLYNFY